jgi:hypothetical protein
MRLGSRIFALARTWQSPAAAGDRRRMRGGCQLHHVHDLQEYSRCEMGDVRQKGQLVIVGADVVVPVACISTARCIGHIHTACMNLRGNQHRHQARLTNGRSEARDSMTPEVLKSKPSAESFGCCALTTRTEYRTEDNTPPLAVPSAEGSPKRCTTVPASTRSGVRK